MATKDGGLPVEQAARELGVPADALRIYVAAHELADPTSATISPSQVESLKKELQNRASALRLDDLAKTALTIEWLAEAAISAAVHDSQSQQEATRLAEEISELRSSKPDLTSVENRIGKLEKQTSNESNNSALQMVGSLQGMLETQSREIDKLRAELQTIRDSVVQTDSKHAALVASLLAALGQGGVPATQTSGKVKAEPSKAVSTTTAASAPTPQVEVAETPAAFQNVPVETPVKYGVRREIEYNFLLERMGFRRLEEYEATEKVEFPSDDQIRDFLSTYELGGTPDEVEIVSVQRGDYAMVQYQRVEKPSGLRGWIPAKRK